MADDTRVTHSRSGFACAFALLCVLGCALPAAARARRHHRAPRRRPERRRARRRARRRGRRSSSGCCRCPNTEVVSVPAADEAAALAALNADPDVRFAAPNVDVHVAAADGRVARSGRCALARRNDADIDGARGLGERCEGQDVTVGGRRPGRRRRRIPTCSATSTPAPRTSSPPTRCTAATPTGLADHGTHVAGIIAAAARQRAASPASRRWRTCCRCAAIDNCGDGQARWRPRGVRRTPARSDIPIVIGLVRAPTRCARRPTKARRPARSPTSSTPTRTRCSSSPPATRATTTTMHPGLPVLHAPARQRRAEHDLRRHDRHRRTGRSCWGNVGRDVGRPVRARASTICSTVRGRDRGYAARSSGTSMADADGRRRGGAAASPGPARLGASTAQGGAPRRRRLIDRRSSRSRWPAGG